MRFVVYGTGAVGGVVGAQLHRAGHDVTLIARGEHHDTIRDQGLTLETPAERITLEIPVVDGPEQLEFSPTTVVLLSVKSQDTAACVEALRNIASTDTPIVCLQNGVDNERTALRLFRNVYGISVMSPTGFLQPGVVQAYSSPVTGILDIGRYPEGVDATCAEVAAAFDESTFVSEPRPDIMRWKYRKLIVNLGNAVQAVCRPPVVGGRIIELASAEGERVLAAAGVDLVSAAEDLERRGDILTRGSIAGVARPGGSVWQSLTRKLGTVETDYLSGHIVMLGRLYGVATPVNGLLQELCAEMAAQRRDPGMLTEAEFLELLESR